MKKYKKFDNILVILLIVVLSVLRFNETQVRADGIYGEDRTLIGHVFTRHSYFYADPINCHTFILDNGNIQIIYRVLDVKTNIQNLVIVEMSETQEIISQKNITLPHTLWGGKILRGDDDCYYVAVGNSTSGKETEIAYCFLKYDKEWNELGRCEINAKESFTSTPYDASNCDMLLSNGVLIAYVGRHRLDSHQSNNLFYIDSNTMEKMYVGGDSPYNHVSHSFNQFVVKSENRIAFLDQGDGYPRGICLSSYEEPNIYTSETLAKSFRNLFRQTIMKFKGESGDNETGVMINGFFTGNNNHMIVGIGINHDELQEDNWESAKQYNIFLINVSKDFKQTNCKFITDYDMFGNIGIKYLYATKTNDKIVLLYNLVDEKNNEQTAFMTLDEQGNILENKIIDAPLCCTSSICVKNNTIYWEDYVDSDYGTYLTSFQWKMDQNNYTAKTIACKKTEKISFHEENKQTIKMYLNDTQKVYVNGFLDKEFDYDENGDEIKIPLALWQIEDASICNVKKNITTFPPGIVYRDGYQYIETQNLLQATKVGKTTCTVQIGKQREKIIILVEEEKPNVSKISNLSITPRKKSIKLSWKKVSGVNGYRISVTAKGSKALSYIVKSKYNKFTINGLKSKQEYTVSIKAYKNYKVANGTTKKAYGKTLKKTIRCK